MTVLCFVQFWCGALGVAHWSSALQRCGTSRCGLWCCHEQFNSPSSEHLSRFLLGIDERYEQNFMIEMKFKLKHDCVFGQKE